MDNNHNPAIMLFKSRPDMDNFLNEVFAFINKNYGHNKTSKMRFNGSRISDNVYIVKFIAAPRMHYKLYDEILINIVSVLGYDNYNKKGVLIGYFDNDGYLWHDYIQFKNKGMAEVNNEI